MWIQTWTKKGSMEPKVALLWVLVKGTVCLMLLIKWKFRKGRTRILRPPPVIRSLPCTAGKKQKNAGPMPLSRISKPSVMLRNEWLEMALLVSSTRLLSSKQVSQPNNNRCLTYRRTKRWNCGDQESSSRPPIQGFLFLFFSFSYIEQHKPSLRIENCRSWALSLIHASSLSSTVSIPKETRWNRDSLAHIVTNAKILGGRFVFESRHGVHSRNHSPHSPQPHQSKEACAIDVHQGILDCLATHTYTHIPAPVISRCAFL